MMKNFPFRGSINIQSKVTKKGIIPFEINCRISGTNSLRSQFGFNDVAFTIQDFYYKREPDMPNITYGSAMRIVKDIIYPGMSLDKIRNKDDKFYIR
jgi:carbamoyl-phosphate synthase large subunit